MKTEEAITRYINHQTNEGKNPRSYARLRVFWGSLFHDTELKDITPEMVEDALQEAVESRGWKPATHNGALVELSGLFSYAMKRRWVESNPCRLIPRLKVKNARTRWLRAGEIQAIKQNSPPWLANLIDAGVCTGLRLSNLLDLKVKDYYDDGAGNSFLIVDSTKNGERQFIPLTGRLKKVVEYKVSLAPSPNQYIFPGPYGGNAHSSFRRYFQEAVEKAGLTWGRKHEDGITIHTLRHTFCAHAFKSGLRESEVMALGGWKTRAMMQRYLHLSPETLTEASRKLTDNF